MPRRPRRLPERPAAVGRVGAREALAHSAELGQDPRGADRTGARRAAYDARRSGAHQAGLRLSMKACTPSSAAASIMLQAIVCSASA